jgi:hypothetical protein
MDEYDRWKFVITSLCPPPEARCAARPTHREHGQVGRAAAPRSGTGTPASAWRRSAIVSVEQQADSSLLVSWSDPTRCRYDEQRWIAAKSRIRGRCALGGQAIEVGDRVYKPQWRGARRPANSAEMILADELDRIAGRAQMP